MQVIASGKVADSPTLEASTTASSNASVDGGAGNGPVLGFGSGASQVCLIIIVHARVFSLLLFSWVPNV